MTTIEKKQKMVIIVPDHGNRYLLYPLARPKKSHKLKKLIFYDLRIIKI